MAKKSLSRTENILENKIDSSTPIEEPPQSRVEKLLTQLNTASGSGPAEVVDLSGIQQGITTLQNKVSTNETILYDGLTSLTNKIKDNEVQVAGQIGYLTSMINDNKTSTDAVIESIENNIEALDEEIHEPEILNAPIKMEGAFPQVLPGYFNDAQMNEMYVWTYFVPDPTGSKLPNKQAGMEHLGDLIKKCFMYHEEFKKLQTSIPNPMEFIVGQFDTISKKYRLRWDEPKDTVLADQAAVIVEKVVIRRKKDSVPTGIADGEEVMTIERRDFHKHKAEWYEDSGNTDTDTENVDGVSMWHYKAFPIATTGFINTSSKNEAIMDYKDYHLFGMVLDQNESNPDSMIQYIEDNKNYRPAHMDFDQNAFDYGDWQSFVDDILQVKPCLMEMVGLESNSNYKVMKPKVYLNKDDYSKTADGQERASFYPEGKKLETYVEFSKLYYLFHDNGDDTVNIYYSDQNLYYDEESNSLRKPLEGEEGSMYNYLFRNWTSANGQTSIEDNHTYVSAYPLVASGFDDYKYGSFENSIPTVDSFQNQLSSMHGDLMMFAHIVFFCPLLVMLIRSTNTLEKYGQGHKIITFYNNDGSDKSTTHTWGTTDENDPHTGGLDKKGLFYGGQGVQSVGVKILGMEHFYGYVDIIVQGLNYQSNIPYVRMDSIGHNLYGSKSDAFKDATLSLAVNDSTNAQFLSKLKWYPDKFLPVETSVADAYTDSTYFCNSIWSKSSTSRTLAIYGNDTICSPKEVGMFMPTANTTIYNSSVKYFFFRSVYITVSGE